MKLQKTLERLQKLHPKKIDLSLNRTFALLKKLGNPQDKLKNVITVCGTNGKYSSIKSLQAILNQAGFKCNIYSSPHLQNYNERYIYNDKQINDDELSDLLLYIEKINATKSLTIFEALTCAYFIYCEKFKENISIIEAGLFHQFDATNVFKKNLCSIITSINIDHLQWINNKTIEGIIHEKTTKLLNSKIFIGKQENEEISLKIKNALKNNESDKFYYGKDFTYFHTKNNIINYKDLNGSVILPRPNILGEHQLENISTAIMVAKTIFDIKNDDIKKAVTNIDIKGRLQKIKKGKLKLLAKNNQIILDGGHNLNAANALVKWIDTLEKNVHLIVGMMRDKEHKKFINTFKNKVKSLTLIDIPNQEGSIKKEEFKLKIYDDFPNVKIANSIKDAIIINSEKSNNSYLVIAGSLYLVGEVLNLN
jgi:dihydrofolate synthase / folylpolyglutamate synthase